jgi:oxygen-independent coproporphyrinogen-3 oxidase
VQSFNNQELKFLGREHSADEALKAIDTVRHQFQNLSIDLIYATPGQTLKAWESCLSVALNLGLPHLSLYQLTIEPGTVFYTRQRAGEHMSLDDDKAADLFNLTQVMTASAGLPAYEISNHAKDAAICQHNLIYWRADDWIGIGPGAHGRFSKIDGTSSLMRRVGTSTRLNPTSWLQDVKANMHGIKIHQDDAPNDLANEMVMMGLRLTDGINLEKIVALCGPYDRWLNLAAVKAASDGGWLDTSVPRSSHESRYTQLKATESGRLRLNSLLSMILK